MFDAVAESLGVSLQIGAIAHAEIQGNHHFLRQVVNNLIDNALKFTAMKAEGPRRVSIDLTRHEQQGIAQLRIKDTGIGINQEHLAHIFDRFYRIDTTRRSQEGVGGNGLGLSIVKSVVESHGGEVSVDSTEGVGTTFTIKLPLARTRADTLAAPSAAAHYRCIAPNSLRTGIASLRASMAPSLTFSDLMIKAGPSFPCCLSFLRPCSFASPASVTLV